MMRPSNYIEACRLWKDRPYNSLNSYLQKRFGEKIFKISLNGGFTCPNRDGTLDHRGCIFCSAGGSGDFSEYIQTPEGLPDIFRQLDHGKKLLSKKNTGHSYIAYFQAFTNTYAPTSVLERLYMEAIQHPEVTILSIATRPDCLSEPVLNLLDRLNRIKPVWIELGLQTIHEETARFIRRGYPLATFTEAVNNLADRGIEIIAHTILGLPGESVSDMIETHRFLSKLPLQGIKLQLLHVLRDTDLATLYGQSPFPVFTLEGYIDCLIQCLEVLSPDMVIHRMTGDGPKNLLIAPQWSCHKKQVLNRIHQEFKNRQTWQGRFFQPSCLQHPERTF